MRNKKNNKIIGSRPKGAVFGIALTSSKMVIKAFFKTKLGWILPLLIVLLLLAAVLALLSLVPVISPFVYPLF